MLSPSATPFSCSPTASTPQEEQHIGSHDNASQKSQKLMKSCVFLRSLSHSFCSLSASYRIIWRLFTTRFYIVYFLDCSIWLILAEIALKCCNHEMCIFPVKLLAIQSPHFSPDNKAIFWSFLFSALWMQLIFSSRLQSTRQVSLHIYTHLYMYIQL